MLEYILSTAASKYFGFFAGLVVATIIFELRMNLRILYRKDDNLKYRPILPVFIVPEWAVAHVDKSNIVKSSKGFLGFGKR